MGSFIKIKTEEYDKLCKNCVYYTDETGYCSVKKKKVNFDKKCRKFELNIMSMSVKKRHTPLRGKYSQNDFDIQL